MCVLPTTGAIRGSDFFFIANSQIDNLNNDKVMDVTRLEVIRIGVLHLPYPAAGEAAPITESGISRDSAVE